MHSGLNQSLDAEIPLVLSGADTLGDIKVSLAAPEAFAKAGVDRHFFLSKLQFTPVAGSNGNYVIKVTSREVMREPFLDFLVEVNWPQGRVLREFTVLLDPPSSLPEPTMAETNAPAIARNPTYDADRIAETQRFQDYPAPTRRTAARPAAPRPAPVSSLPPPSAAQIGDTAYGPVRRDESLWSIARLIERDPSVTQDQMMVALFRANPQAFAGGRINALKAGSLLRVPTPDYIAQIAPQQARAEFARQQGWNGGGAARPTEPATAEESAAPPNQLKLLSPTEARSAKARTGTGEAEGNGRAKSDLALEVAETVKQETEDLRQQLQQLKQELGNMQRMINLKDEQLSALQAQRQTAPPKPAPQPETASPPQPPLVRPEIPPNAAQPSIPQPAPTAKPPETTASPVTPRPVPAPVKPAPVASKPAAPVAAEPSLPFDSTYLLAGGGALGIAGITAWLIIRRRNAIIAETESILLAAERESLQKSQFVASKPSVEQPMTAMPEPMAATKSSFLSEFTPSDFDALGAETDEVDPVSEADVYLAYGRYKQAEELIRHAIAQHPGNDECKLKLLEIYYATENRSAFESYAQELKQQGKSTQEEFWGKVEEMGRELLGDNALFQAAAPGPRPGGSGKSGGAVAKALGSLDLSDDLIDDLKRFEIEFLDASSPADGGEEDGFLDFGAAPETTTPDFPDFGGVPAAPAKGTHAFGSVPEAPAKDTHAAHETAADEYLELTADTGNTADEYLELTADARTEADKYLELNAAPAEADEYLELGAAQTPPDEHRPYDSLPAATPPKTEGAFGSLDFDLDFLNADTAQPADSQATSHAGELENLIPFDLGTPSEPQATVAPESRTDKTIDDILRELTSQMAQEPAPTAVPAHTEREPLGTLDFGFDFDLLEAANQGGMAEEEAASETPDDKKEDLFAGLTDMDQFETKLDLAKAYADMDDEESAREILQEVAAKGNERQRLEAATLLEGMGLRELQPQLSMAQPRTQHM